MTNQRPTPSAPHSAERSYHAQPVREDHERQEAEQRERDRLAEIEAQREVFYADAQERANAEIDAMRADLLSAWRLQGGSVNDFDAQWPQMRLDIIRQRAIEQMDAARDAQRRRMREVMTRRRG